MKVETSFYFCYSTGLLAHIIAKSNVLEPVIHSTYAKTDNGLVPLSSPQGKFDDIVSYRFVHGPYSSVDELKANNMEFFL